MRTLFATMQAREGVEATRVVGIVALNKARDMFALILELLMEFAPSIVDDSKRGEVNLVGVCMTAT